MMVTFIKTTKGFFNVDQITFMSVPDEEDKIYIDLNGDQGRYWFEGVEAVTLTSFFNRMALLDTTFQPEASEFPHGEFDNGNHWIGQDALEQFSNPTKY